MTALPRYSPARESHLNFRGVGYTESLADWRASYFHPDDVAAVRSANLPHMLATVQIVAAAMPKPSQSEKKI